MVNGRIVDIKNIDIFEKAAEGTAVNRTLPNIIPNDTLNLDFDLVEKYINAYKKFYASLPFPLYGVDTDLKYCAAGLFIKKETATNIRMWTNNGLFICVDADRKLALGFVNNSWGIVYVNEIKEDNLNIQNYRDNIGFEEFVWVTASLFKGEGTSKYYEVFMPKFVEACGSQHVVMRWELGNILQFGNIPDRMTMQLNKVIDLNNKSNYTLDIFVAGTRETKDKQQVWSFYDSDTRSEVKSKSVKVYGYDLYNKPIITGDSIKAGEDKIKPAELYGINSLFCTLCTIKSVGEADDFPDFLGFIADGNLVFSVDGRVFVAKSDNYTEAKEVARGVEIYSYKRGVVYLSKPKVIAAGIKKEVIYSYSLVDGNLRLCKIQFVRT